jgi:hypothetical protein
VPLLHKLAKLVAGDVHAIEVGIAIVALHFFNLNLYFSPVLVVALVLEVSQRYFEDSSFQTISCIL